MPVELIMRDIMKGVGIDFAALAAYVGLDRLTAAGDGLAHLAAAWLGVVYIGIRTAQIWRQYKKDRNEKSDTKSLG